MTNANNGVYSEQWAFHRYISMGDKIKHKHNVGSYPRKLDSFSQHIVSYNNKDNSMKIITDNKLLQS